MVTKKEHRVSNGARKIWKAITRKARDLVQDRKALDRLQNPDDLDRYLRMTTPGIWISIIACAAILLGIGAWAVFGSVSDHITLRGDATKDGIVLINWEED